MASIRKEVPLEVSAEHVWSVVRDIGALHTRLVPGFVVDTRLEADARVVTFGNGMVVRELIVDLDDGARRLAWSARGGRLSHHNASVQVFAEGAGPLSARLDRRPAAQRGRRRHPDDDRAGGRHHETHSGGPTPGRLSDATSARHAASLHPQ